MDNSVIGGGLLQGSAGGILDLEHPIHRFHPSMIPQPQPHHLHPAMTLSADHPMSLFEASPVKAVPQPPLAAQNRPKFASFSASDDEDDHEHEQDSSFANDDVGPDGPRGKKGSQGSSPWQRMKWTDDMIRLLINVVTCVGDDGTPDSCDGTAGAKRKLGGGGAVLQKKGKWKTVSKVMLEKGCYVSPQQCEDKFNDLNKRYKRLNEILGRGTTCQVVENPALLDSMPHIPAKAKDDVRKILASKHLFYREMCAYHNGHKIPNSHDAEASSCAAPSCTAVPMVGLLKHSDGVEEDEDDDDEDDEENTNAEGRSIDLGKTCHDIFQVEVDGVLQDGTKTVCEVQDWFKKRALQLLEERVEIQAEAFELEKKKFKWQRFCSKKDRELERLTLENERTGLENERMTLQVKQREADLEVRRSAESGPPSGFFIGEQQLVKMLE